MFRLYDLEEQYIRYPEIRRDEVLKLLQWSLGQYYLPKITEHEALLFFTASGCNLADSKELLVKNASYRTHFKEFFDNLDVESHQIERMQKTVAGFPLDGRTPEGYGVVVAKILDTNETRFNFINAIKLYCMNQDKWLLETGVIPGLIFVIDCEGASVGHTARINIFRLRKVLQYLQEGMPVRVTGLHFINVPNTINNELSCLYLLMNDEFLQLIHVHHTLDSFYQFVPQHILPRDYGGSGLSVKQLNDIHVEKLHNFRWDIIRYNRQHGLNLELGPKEFKNFNRTAEIKLLNCIELKE